MEAYMEAKNNYYAEDLMGIIYTTMFREQLNLIVCG